MAITRPPVLAPWADGVGSPAVTLPGSGLRAAGYAGGDIPAHGDHNWLFNLMTNAARYFSLRGVSNWDSTETGYVAGDVCKSSDGAIYVLVGTPTTGLAPQSDRPNWSRWLVRDRWGYQRDRRVSWDQGFASIEAASNLFPLFSTLGPVRWGVGSTVTSGIASVTCGVVRAVSRLQSLAAIVGPGGAADHTTLFTLDSQLDFRDDNVPVLDLDVALGTVGANGCDVWVGIGKGDPFASGGADWYCAFIKRAADTNWQIQTKGGGSAGSITTTGVPPVANTLQRLRVEMAGANRADTGGNVCRFFINGTQVGGNQTANLPSSSTNPECRVFAGVLNNSTAGRALYVGDAKFRSNTWAADAF